MNPDQPSREQIEARLTALLLGELPAAEADLLRWTISRDPELQKLHDQLAATIGFMREAMKNPTGAPLDKDAPLKLPLDRRQTLLAHFKTTRPQPPQKSVWLERIEIPSMYSLTIAAIVIFMICGVVAISIPNFVKARATNQSNAIINNLRQIDAAKDEWALENKKSANEVPTLNDLSPYMQTMRSVAGENYIPGKVSQPTVAEINGKVLTAIPGHGNGRQDLYLGMESTISGRRTTESAERNGSTSQQNATVNNTRQNTAAAGEWELETGKVHQGAAGVAGAERLADRMPQAPKVPPPQVQIALPNTESSQAESEQNDTNIFSQNVVGYVNPGPDANPVRMGPAPKTEVPAPPPTVVMAPPAASLGLQTGTETASSGPVITVSAGAGAIGSPESGPKNGPYFAYPSTPPQGAGTESTFGNTIPQELTRSMPSAMAPEPTVNESYNPDSNSTISPIPAGGTYNLVAAGNLPQVIDQIPRKSQNATPVLGDVPTLGALPASKGENPPDSPALMPPRLRQQYGEKNETQAQPQSQQAWSGITVINEALSARNTDTLQASAPEVQTEPTVTGGNSGTTSFGDASANNRSTRPFANRLQNAMASATNDASDGIGLADAASQQAQARGEAGSASGSIPKNNFSARFQFDLPTDSITNAIAMDKFATRVAASGQSGLTTREESNTKKTLDDDERLVAVETPIHTPSTVTTNMAFFLGPQRQSVILDGDRNIGYKTDILRAPRPAAPIPQPEIQTADNAFSTFSMNVSDVSFKLAMASLQKGQMPAPASIRSEEFINAFDYHDPEPLQGEPLTFAYERAGDPFAQECDLLRFSIKAAAVGRQDGRALNLVLLLDTSGSMERADRVAIIREALRVLSSQLQPQDVVSVVSFARTARLWADGVPGDQAGATLDKVGGITPEGGTNLEEAMRLAYETALRHFIAGGMNRVVLLTDGAANLGNVDPQVLTEKVESERREGIALDCFGIGWDDYNDDLLEQLSSNGDGRYAFINSPDEAKTEFAAKLAGALQVAAEDVKVQVEFNPSRVTAWRQIGYAKHQLTKEQFRDNSVAAGAIAAREAGNALYVIETKTDGEGPIATVRVRYRIPGTQDNRERSWLVEYTGAAPELAQSSPPMRLAATAAEISEWMAESPFAQEVTPDALLNYLSGVPQFYGTDERPKQLEWMIRKADALKR